MSSAHGATRRVFKYRQISVAGTRERLIAYLHAWLLLGQDLDTKEEHREATPSEADIDRHVQLLFPADHA